MLLALDLSYFSRLWRPWRELERLAARHGGGLRQRGAPTPAAWRLVAANDSYVVVKLD